MSPSNTLPATPRMPVTSAFKVDVSRGERIGRVSSKWFSRPDDKCYLSLCDLYAGVRARKSGDRPHGRDPGHAGAADVARAGAFGSIGSDGQLRVDRGYVRPEDEAPAEAEPDSDADGSGVNPSHAGQGRDTGDPVRMPRPRPPLPTSPRTTRA